MVFRVSQIVASVRSSAALAAALTGLCGGLWAADAPAPKKAKAGKPAAPDRVAGTTLDARSAAIVANAVCQQIKGGRVIAVEPSENMGPVFETRALLVVEPTRTENLRIGDIVTYEHPRRQETVVQRVLEMKEGQFLSEGGVRLGSADTGGVMRVVVILYVRDDSGSKGLAASTTPTPRAKNATDGAVEAAQVR